MFVVRTISGLGIKELKLSHRTTCHTNAIDMHATPRCHETDSSEPHVNDGYMNNSMFLQNKNTIILNKKYEEDWNS